MKGTTFADDIIEELLDRTEKGESLTQLCRDARMPKRRTVYDWLEQDQAFAARFRDARARGIHALAEECIQIADEPAADAVEVAHKRVRIDTRLRLAGKWLPSIYGDKVTAEVSGTIQHEHVTPDAARATITSYLQQAKEKAAETRH